MMLRWFAAVAALACSTSPASPYFDTGNSLYELCQNPRTYPICLGTIIGHYDMLLANGYDCGPDNQRTKQQIMDIVVKYLKDNPAERSDVAALATYRAMTAAFACKQIPKG
ncbi:Rap1a/Tai family immunity protein [Bradyrhizobium japonicum]|uniref:Rap1a/Tai family immunity protein n=1 Tax=Bradyrhizobium japonicum TaxID=375 RepID=UPI001BA676E8|nr:Rap1a/Tai family immunity protein [Bradyrhizobium japonicum]MBR0915816.1 hypothetical protein [Bradyrhizobium japonicum]